MKMSAPRFTTWVLAAILGGAGVLMHLGFLHLGSLNRYAFWLVTAAFGLLFLAAIFRNL